MIILGLLIAVVAIVWIYGFFVSNDLGVRSGHIQKFKKALVIYPHPDDETLASGGLIRLLTSQRTHVTVVVLTKGEKGNDDAHLDLTLKDIRKKELMTAMKILGVKKVILEDFGDGQLATKKPQLTKYIASLIQNIHPDLIVTYDLAGLYGHEDHITVSEIVTGLVKKTYPTVKLLYPSLPKKLLRMIKLPEYMAKDPLFTKRRVTPTMKVFVGVGVIQRIRAMYAYKSQLYSFSKGMPIPAVPLWFYYSMQLFEHYHKAN